METSITESPKIVEKNTSPVLREKILGFERFLSTMPGVFYGDTENCPLKHSFADGMYVREIFIPKGTVVVGKIHRHSHPNFLLKGEVTVITEGGGRERLKAPLSMISPAATKRVVFAHEDTVWVTVHLVGEEQNLEKIEDIVIAKTYEELGIECEKIIEIESEEFKTMIAQIKSEDL